MTPYHFALRSQRWVDFTRRLKHEAKYRCQKCGVSFRTTPWDIDVHHIENDYARHPCDWPSDNFRVLCHYCHGEEHGLFPLPDEQEWLFPEFAEAANDPLFKKPKRA